MADNRDQRPKTKSAAPSVGNTFGGQSAMNYLWDKSGSDPEIEKLEDALRVFRYKETQAPALLMNNVVAFKKKDSRKVFSLPVTIAAAVALMAVISGLWFFISSKKENVGNYVALGIRQEEEIPWEMLPIEKKKRVVLVPIAKNVHRSTPKPKDDEIRLTDEERYAYEQLMKALKITSDKLNYIKQKTQGEEKEKSNTGSE
jgi:hypothetical protein